MQPTKINHTSQKLQKEPKEHSYSDLATIKQPTKPNKTRTILDSPIMDYHKH